MLNAIMVSIRFILLILGGQKQLALENAALRQQLAVFKRNVPRPKLNNRDRLFWIGLYLIWAGLEIRVDIRAVRNRHVLASRAVQTVLAEVISTRSNPAAHEPVPRSVNSSTPWQPLIRHGEHRGYTVN